MELLSYSKMLTYHPARADALVGLASCPPELRGTVAVEARRWLESLPSPASVSFGELAARALGAATGPWTLRHRRDVAAALATLGYAMEPDPEDGNERIEDGTIVQVFRCSTQTRSRNLEVACAAAMFVAAVGRTVEGGNRAATEHWLSKVPTRLKLSPDETTRLRARLAWYETKAVTLAKAKKLLGDASPEEKEFCAWSATVAAGATGDIGKAQIAALEAIHDSLGVPRSTLYAGLHAGIGGATAGARDPVLVDGGEHEPVHPIPRPPPKPDAPERGRIDESRAETERVSKLLADIFVEEEPTTQHVEEAAAGPFAGLDAGHAGLLKLLLSQPEWSRDEFDRAATGAGLMPGGAMETINEWAFDHHGDALIEEGGETIAVNAALLGVEAAAD
jgi:hypothetical protein